MKIDRGFDLTARNGHEDTAFPGLAKETTPSAKRASPDGIKVGTDAIGEALKAYFDGLVSEPVPDRFLDLLSRLDDK